MLHEHRLETRTKGLVCGPELIVPDAPSFVRVAKDKLGIGLYLADPRPTPWAPVVVSYKVGIRSRETGEEIWVRPFSTLIEAQFCYIALCGVEARYPDRAFSFPSVWDDCELSYYIATVTTYNSTTNNSGLDWSAGGTACPTGVSATDYLLIAGGAGGGYLAGGGGGAGGLKSGTGVAVTATTNYPVTIGAGGAGSSASGNKGSNGNDSTWNSLTSLKGGGGGSNGSINGTGGSSTYGSGGGQGGNAVGPANNAAGTAGQGNQGGSALFTANYGSGGGGGSSASGANAPNSNTCGAGGDGTASSISGSSVTYAGGGGGGAGLSATPGAAGSGGAGAGSATAGGDATANRGSGGGGGYTGGAGDGSSGVLILSWTVSSLTYTFNSPMLGM